jgi:hypothetical protein
MSENYRWLASNPAVQPFNIKGSPCKSKKNSWWAAGSGKYWRNGNASNGASRAKDETDQQQQQ